MAKKKSDKAAQSETPPPPPGSGLIICRNKYVRRPFSFLSRRRCSIPRASRCVIISDHLYAGIGDTSPPSTDHGSNSLPRSSIRSHTKTSRCRRHAWLIPPSSTMLSRSEKLWTRLRKTRCVHPRASAMRAAAIATTISSARVVGQVVN